MKLTVVDYSEVYFVTLHDGEIPRKRDGKFVLLDNANDRYVIFSPRGLSRYHANIVDRFLGLRGIKGRYNAKRDAFLPESQDWEIVGGGHWTVDEDEGTLRLYGFSQAYGGVDLRELGEHLRAAGGIEGVQRVLAG